MRRRPARHEPGPVLLPPDVQVDRPLEAARIYERHGLFFIVGHLNPLAGIPGAL